MTLEMLIGGLITLMMVAVIVYAMTMRSGLDRDMGDRQTRGGDKPRDGRPRSDR